MCAGERFNQRGFAVIDVSGGADNNAFGDGIHEESQRAACRLDAPEEKMMCSAVASFARTFKPSPRQFLPQFFAQQLADRLRSESDGPPQYNPRRRESP